MAFFRLFSVDASVGAVAEACLVHAAYAVHDSGLAYAGDHLAPGEAGFERNFGGAVIVVGSEIHAVLLAFFGIVRAKAEQLAARNCRRTVGIDHAAHSAVHAAFHDNDTAGNIDTTVTVYAIRIASTYVDVVESAGHLEIACASATETAAPAASAARITGHCASAAGRVPAVIRGDDARDAAFEIHVWRFHSFVCHGDAHVRVVFDIEGLVRVDAVVIRLYGHFASGEGDGAAAVNAIVTAADFDNAVAYDDAGIALDPLHAGIGCARITAAKSSGKSATGAAAALETSATAISSVPAGASAKAVLPASGRDLDGRGLVFSV